MNGINHSADHIAAHEHSSCHRMEIEASETCGCFYCLKTYSPEEIEEWIDESPHRKGETALCPRCGIDAVIGSASGYPLARESLMKMNQYWF